MLSRTIYDASDKKIIIDIPENDGMSFTNIIDTHNHLRGYEYVTKASDKGRANITVESSLTEALKGGIRQTISMPNTTPGLTKIEPLMAYMLRLETQPGRHFVHFGVTDTNFEDCNLALQSPRVAGLKVYPAAKGADKSVTTSFDGGGSPKPMVTEFGAEKSSTFYKAVELATYYGKPVTVHCEELNSDGKLSKDEMEINFVKNRVLKIAEAIPGSIIVVAHTTLAETVEAVVEFNQTIGKKNGSKIVMEIAPHHQWLNRDDDTIGNTKEGIFNECHPQIKSRKDQKYMAALLNKIGQDGLYIMFGTDHAPHSERCKLNEYSRGIPNFRDALSLVATTADNVGADTRQLNQFLAGQAQEIFSVINQEKSYPIINKPDFSRKTILIKKPTIIKGDYYDGQVINPFKGRKILWNLIDKE